MYKSMQIWFQNFICFYLNSAELSFLWTKTQTLKWSRIRISYCKGLLVKISKQYRGTGDLVKYRGVPRQPKRTRCPRWPRYCKWEAWPLHAQSTRKAATPSPLALFCTKFGAPFPRACVRTYCITPGAHIEVISERFLILEISMCYQQCHYF